MKQLIMAALALSLTVSAGLAQMGGTGGGMMGGMMGIPAAR